MKKNKKFFLNIDFSLCGNRATTRTHYNWNFYCTIIPFLAHCEQTQISRIQTLLLTIGGGASSQIDLRTSHSRTTTTTYDSGCILAWYWIALKAGKYTISFWFVFIFRSKLTYWLRNFYNFVHEYPDTDNLIVIRIN